MITDANIPPRVSFFAFFFVTCIVVFPVTLAATFFCLFLFTAISWRLSLVRPTGGNSTRVLLQHPLAPTGVLNSDDPVSPASFAFLALVEGRGEKNRRCKLRPRIHRFSARLLSRHSIAECVYTIVPSGMLHLHTTSSLRLLRWFHWYARGLCAFYFSQVGAAKGCVTSPYTYVYCFLNAKHPLSPV